MPRHALAVLLSSVFLSAPGCGPDLMSRMPFIGPVERHLPGDNAVPGLVRISKVSSYRGNDIRQYLGENAGTLLQYGATGLSVAEYTYGDPAKSLSIESFSMEDQVAAAGIFHYFRGQRLRNMGQPLPVGAGAVLDVRRDSRNLYFYKRNYFIKVIYTGGLPAPDLQPLGQAIAAGIPGGDEQPPEFALIAVEGVDADSARLSPGYTYNCDFLPPGILAKAPGAGSPVAEVFFISHSDDKAAAKTGQDYRTYLQLNGRDFSLDRGGWRGRPTWRARDPHEGRVICTVHRNYLIGVARPQTYEMGAEILERIVAKINRK